MLYCSHFFLSKIPGVCVIIENKIKFSGVYSVAVTGATNQIDSALAGYSAADGQSRGCRLGAGRKCKFAAGRSFLYDSVVSRRSEAGGKFRKSRRLCSRPRQ